MPKDLKHNGDCFLIKKKLETDLLAPVVFKHLRLIKNSYFVPVVPLCFDKNIWHMVWYSLL